VSQVHELERGTLGRSGPTVPGERDGVGEKEENRGNAKDANQIG
jgi:hypothetical protein